MRRTRIALITPYALSVFGGVQEQVLAMSRELSGRDYEVMIVAPDVHDVTTYDTAALVRRFGRLWSIPTNGSRAPLSLSPLAARRARDVVDRFQPDVVHFHEPFAPLIGWGILRAHRAPAIGTFHRSGDGPALRYTGALLRSLASHLDAVAAVSEPAAATVRHATRLDPSILFNGFETDRFVVSPRERPPTPVIVTVGRLEPRKGTAHTIEAVRAHNASGGEQWQLVVIGDGPQRRTLEALAAHDDMIRFTGALSDTEKRAWLRRASVVVASATRGESFGLVVLEPMASEVMVVASDIAGYREAAGSHAELFEPGDATSLRHALGRALASETPRRIGDARAHAQHWSMARLIDDYEVLYAKAREHYEAAR